jgi:hypothetical protein
MKEDLKMLVTLERAIELLKKKIELENKLAQLLKEYENTVSF